MLLCLCFQFQMLLTGSVRISDIAFVLFKWLSAFRECFSCWFNYLDLGIKYLLFLALFCVRSGVIYFLVIGSVLCRPIVKPNQQIETNEESPVPSVELPDASLLLNSPTSSSLFSGSDHSSRVAAAMAANASRKRETNVLGSSLPRSKVPRSSLPHPKNVPDTSGSLLVPPQLTGRFVLMYFPSFSFCLC